MGLLWFRRSRPKEEKQQPEPEPELSHTFARQSRVPLRLRGLLLLNLGPADGLDQIENAPPLGSRDEVMTTVQESIPGMLFDADGKGELAGSDHRVSIDLGREAQVHAAVAAVEGDTGIELLRTVLERQGWRAYAPRSGVFIEPDALDLFALPLDAPPHSRL